MGVMLPGNVLEIARMIVLLYSHKISPPYRITIRTADPSFDAVKYAFQCLRCVEDSVNRIDWAKWVSRKDIFEVGSKSSQVKYYSSVISSYGMTAPRIIVRHLH